MDRKYLIPLILILAAFTVLMVKCPPSETPVIREIVKDIDTIENRVVVRDTLFIPRYQIIRKTDTLREIITQYRTIRDTVEKLNLCDSIVEKCDSLAVEYVYQDSLHREQEKDLKLIVDLQKNQLDEKDKQLEDKDKQAKKDNRDKKLIAGVGVLLAIAIALLR